MFVKMYNLVKEYLATKDKIGHFIFDYHNFTLYSKIPKDKASKYFSDAINKGDIKNLYGDFYYNPASNLLSPYIRDDFLEYLRPNDFFYISHELMLYKYGFLEHPTMALTVATTGESEYLDTSEGTIIFRHVNIDDLPSLERELLYDSNRGQYVATPRIAIHDALNEGIPFDYPSDKYLTFVEDSIPELYQLPNPNDINYEIYKLFY